MKKIFISMMAIGALSLALTFCVKTFDVVSGTSLVKSNIEALTDEEDNDCIVVCRKRSGYYCETWSGTTFTYCNDYWPKNL